MMKLSSVFEHAVAACGLLASLGAQAGVLFAINDTTDQLVTIDRTTYAVTTVGSLGVGGDFGDLTYNKLNNTLYAVGGRSNNSLYTVNQTTGAATLVGSHGINDMFALAFDPSTVTMYAQATNGTLYTLDLTTGAATAVGNNSIYPGGLAYNSASNQLLLLAAGSGNVSEINRGTGAGTLLASGAGFIDDNGFTFDEELGGYWAADWSSGLYRFDAAFNPTTVANLGSRYAAIAFVGDAVQGVPEPTTLLLVGAGLLGAAAARRRKS